MLLSDIQAERIVCISALLFIAAESVSRAADSMKPLAASGHRRNHGGKSRSGAAT